MSNSSAITPGITELFPPSTTPFQSDLFNDDYGDDILLGIVVTFLFTIAMQYGGQAIVATMVALIFYQIYSYLIYPFVFEYYKIGYHKTLRRLKVVLEQGIPDDLQTNKRVINSYLKVYHQFCKLRIMAKRDYLGVVDTRDDTWEEFDSLNFKKGYIRQLKSLV